LGRPCEILPKNPSIAKRPESRNQEKHMMERRVSGILSARDKLAW